MYIISKVVEDYEGTWSNALMYETDLEKAIKIADELQEAIVTLKQSYVAMKSKINEELKKSFPNHKNYELEFEDQMKNIDENDTEHYYDKEDRMLKEATEQGLTEKEKFLYAVSYLSSGCQLMYFEVRKLQLSDKVLNEPVDRETFWGMEYSTKEKSKQHKEIFEIYPE